MQAGVHCSRGWQPALHVAWAGAADLAAVSKFGLQMPSCCFQRPCLRSLRPPHQSASEMASRCATASLWAAFAAQRPSTSKERHQHDVARLSRRQQLLLSGSALLTAPLAAPLVAAAADSTRQQQRVAEIERAYDSYAATYDEIDGGAAAEQLGFPVLRQELLAAARGDVLETGVGTGLNLPLYQPSALTSLTGVDLSGGMLARAAARADALRLGEAVPLRLAQADVAALGEALEGRTFDTGGCPGG